MWTIVAVTSSISNSSSYADKEYDAESILYYFILFILIEYHSLRKGS
jgi:hypothetical protein